MIKIEKFNVRIVNTGDKYGVNDCLTNDKGPMIEFYDSRFKSGWDQERGQFVTRYYVETLLSTGEYPAGLCLDGGVEAWTVSAEGMRQVMELLGAPQPTNESGKPGERQATEREIELARERYAFGSDDNIEIDDNAKTAPAEDGVWVAAWVYLPTYEDGSV